MAWVRGIREVRQVTVALDDDLVGLRRGPVLTKQQRVITELAPRAIAQTVGTRALTFLPTNTGAGPCGTRARGLCQRRMVDPNKFRGQRWVCGDRYQPVMSPSPLRWSIEHLVEPLAAWYATYEEPMHFGAKSGPRGRKAA